MATPNLCIIQVTMSFTGLIQQLAAPQENEELRLNGRPGLLRPALKFDARVFGHTGSSPVRYNAFANGRP